MKPDNPESQAVADLNALGAAAHGRPIPRQSTEPVVPVLPAEEEARAARIAELRARYKAGELLIDEKALVAKLLDSLFE